jgi:osmotically-inducible protein OsmY
VKSDTELVEDVTDELFFDPRINDSDAIAVGADDGTVALRGTVGSFHQKRNAAKAAKRVLGVTNVLNLGRATGRANSRLGWRAWGRA